MHIILFNSLCTSAIMSYSPIFSGKVHCWCFSHEVTNFFAIFKSVLYCLSKQFSITFNYSLIICIYTVFIYFCSFSYFTSFMVKIYTFYLIRFEITKALGIFIRIKMFFNKRYVKWSRCIFSSDCMIFVSLKSSMIFVSLRRSSSIACLISFKQNLIFLIELYFSYFKISLRIYRLCKLSIFGSW